MSKQDLHVEIIARGILLRGSRVLLCQNLKHEYFYLPGGHVEFSESAAAAISREFLEETGKRITPTRLVLLTENVFSTRKRQHHELNLVFLVEPAFSGENVKSREPDIGFTWCELAAVADLDIRPEGVKAWLASQAGHIEPGRVDFVSEISKG